MISAQSYSPPRESENRSILKYFKAPYSCPDSVVKKINVFLPLRINIHSAK